MKACKVQTRLLICIHPTNVNFFFHSGVLKHQTSCDVLSRKDVPYEYDLKHNPTKYLCHFDLQFLQVCVQDPYHRTSLQLLLMIQASSRDILCSSDAVDRKSVV